MSQGELAAALAVTRSIISAWENNNRVPRPDKLAALRVWTCRRRHGLAAARDRECFRSACRSARCCARQPTG
jgi:transcriptional regulator with XRE-family HTH domain